MRDGMSHVILGVVILGDGLITAVPSLQVAVAEPPKLTLLDARWRTALASSTVPLSLYFVAMVPVIVQSSGLPVWRDLCPRSYPVIVTGTRTSASKEASSLNFRGMSAWLLMVVWLARLPAVKP